ncbi:putative membrane-bound dehydrogenase-like protein [Dyadobacter jejuensis]|uniref:Putative membrane-bound dehydrogenase-like protein n=1 Tax=Dyadobacter jejuensis TaxID=1082580 RepID=A0A316A701_9BACT|nr:PVC-type heme-binding CxxCH protein [Dyadobacter jejuensis]PWJ53373.1 putative membrane-bound dehydrogenase-like protein [Dyadobacter jejuensis]
MKFTSYSFVFLSLFYTSACTPSKYADPLSPEASLQSIDLNPDFKIELFAAEPLVMDPVGMAFDEYGRVFVVEMPDYPTKPETGKGRGRIKMLTDSDGDGRMDKAILFAENLSEASSILPWKGGLLVTAAPNIWFMKDTNGDLQADLQEKLFDGFYSERVENQLSSLTLGIDNWIYVANYGQPGKVRALRPKNRKELDVLGADFRFRPDKNKFEREMGNAQFGQTFNDWGHRFITENTVRIQQIVMPWRYANRNPYMPTHKGAMDISDQDNTMFQVTPAPYWRAERTRRRNERFQQQGLDRVEYAEDYFTAASGGIVYTGHTFPKAFQGNYFVGDVAGNLVHRDLLVADSLSPVYKAVKRFRKDTNKEFLSSSDPWFRPVSFTVGPDGALYVIDFYRQHVETPESIPDDLKEDMAFKNGENRGRIYKITPVTPASSEQAAYNLGAMSSKLLVGLLSFPNQWQRLQAQRLLLERQDKSIVPTVLALQANATDPLARLHALFVLEGLGALSPAALLAALHDPHPGVREYGAMLAENTPSLTSEVAKMVEDSSVRVAYQATLSLGGSQGPNITEAMRKVLIKRGQDPWLRMAVLSGHTAQSTVLLDSLKYHSAYFDSTTADRIQFIEDFAFIQGAKNKDRDLVKMLDCLADTTLPHYQTWTKSLISGLVHGRKYQSDNNRLGPLTKERLSQLALKSDDPSKELLDALLK